VGWIETEKHTSLSSSVEKAEPLLLLLLTLLSDFSTRARFFVVEIVEVVFAAALPRADACIELATSLT
jgi:hypothetical protein